MVTVIRTIYKHRAHFQLFISYLQGKAPPFYVPLSFVPCRWKLEENSDFYFQIFLFKYWSSTFKVEVNFASLRDDSTIKSDFFFRRD